MLLFPLFTIYLQFFSLIENLLQISVHSSCPDCHYNAMFIACSVIMSTFSIKILFLNERTKKNEYFFIQYLLVKYLTI